MTGDGDTAALRRLDDDALLAAVRARGAVPRHIAIIMDGNGRWARRRYLPRVAGHRAGRHAVRRCVDACGQCDTGEVCQGPTGQCPTGPKCCPACGV